MGTPGQRQVPAHALLTYLSQRKSGPVWKPERSSAGSWGPIAYLPPAAADPIPAIRLWHALAQASFTSSAMRLPSMSWFDPRTTGKAKCFPLDGSLLPGSRRRASAGGGRACERGPSASTVAMAVPVPAMAIAERRADVSELKGQW